MSDLRAEVERWTPPEVIGLCPNCHDEFYVPHGGKCPAEHYDETPDLIEYVPAAALDEALECLREIRDTAWEDNALDPQRPARLATATLTRLEER